jgi:hypothetical protein
MPNIADREAHAAWLAERPAAERPAPYEYADLENMRSSSRSSSTCSCSADPAHDARHACRIHPPF